jgi:hypothetical protein
MCDNNCGCGNQKQNKCNTKKYTSPLIYDGENFDCTELNSVKSNCTPLNTILKLFADKICELFGLIPSVVHYSEGDGIVIALPSGSWGSVVHTQYTIPVGGNGKYEFAFNCEIDSPGVVRTAGAAAFFINGVQYKGLSGAVNKAREVSVTGADNNTGLLLDYFLSEIPLVEGDVVEIKGSGDISAPSNTNRMISTVYKLTKIS